MTDRPMLFSGPMVSALLRGTKTQTRRIFKPQPTMHAAGDCTINGHRGDVDYLMRDIAPRYWLRIKVGDRLWVRETFKPIPALRPGGYFVEGSPFFGREFFYQADGNCPLWADGRWKPSLHMPRAASRLTLTVTDVRVQRLQECSKSDALAEGVVEFFRGPERLGWPAAAAEDAIAAASELGIDGPVEMYRDLWEHINGKGSWDANPWVAAYTFTVQRGNIDQLARAA